MNALTWFGIVFCIVHSAMFSGLNLGMFGVSRLRLEVQEATGDEAAARVLALRRNAHFLLTTILWGNVAVNCLLAILLDSMMAGLSAWLVSTIGITLFGEIMPQAYFSRHSLRVGAAMAPFLQFYKIVLAPVAWPSAKLLDLWLGEEGAGYFREQDVRELISRHMRAEEAEIDRVEGIGALNFLAIDDMAIEQEGEPIDPRSVIQLPVGSTEAMISAMAPEVSHDFAQRVQASGKKWVVLTDRADEPRLVINAAAMVRDLLRGRRDRAAWYCHRPVVVRDPKTPLGDAIRRLRVQPVDSEDDVIDQDLILLWSGEHRQVITGADLLGRLLRGIVPAAPGGSPLPGREVPRP